MSTVVQEIKDEVVYLRSAIAKLEWENCYSKVNPWLDMSNTARTRVNYLRQMLFSKLQLTNDTAQCWLTGVVGTVKVAHIIPNFADTYVLNKFGLRQDFKNNQDLNQTKFYDF